MRRVQENRGAKVMRNDRGLRLLQTYDAGAARNRKIQLGKDRIECSISFVVGMQLNDIEARIPGSARRMCNIAHSNK